MRSIHILPLLTMVMVPGCDGTGDWARGPAAANAYAAPLASDTTVVTTRRVWSSSGLDTLFGAADGLIMPNGARLVVPHWDTGDLALFDLATREFHRIGMNDEPYDKGSTSYAVPSPDGSRVAADWHDHIERQLQLRVVDLTTGEWRIIMTPDTAVTSSLLPVAWTPAGDSVLAIAGHPDRRHVEVTLVPAAGGTPRVVHTIPPGRWPVRMTFSPDGRWLLYDHELSRDQHTRSDIYIIDVHGGGARPLAEHPAVDLLVGWLPGTDVVLFSSDRSGTTDLWSVRVVNGRANAEPRRVRSGFLKSRTAGFGDGALFYSVQTGSEGISIIDVDPQSGTPLGAASPPLEHLSSHPRGLAWSADGRNLAALTEFRRDMPNAITLHAMKTGESRVFWLDENVSVSAFAWTPDGKALLLRVPEPDPLSGATHFLRLDLVTGRTTRVFAAAEPEEPIPLLHFLVTPDGRSIVLRQQRTLDDGRTGTKIVLRSLEDGSERELHRTSGFVTEFSISAYGEQLAFMKQVWEKSDSLFVLRIDGSEPLRYLASWDYDDVTLLGWLPAGDALLAARLMGPYSSREVGPAEEILRIELDGSESVAGTSPFSPARGAKHQGWARSRLLLSPAGNGLAHKVYVRGQEFWRMDGLHELFADDAAGRR